MFLTLLASGVSAHAQQGAAATPGAKMTTPRSAVSRVQGFNIVLVLGELAGAPPDAYGNVPPAARKALFDMSAFLPYKYYRLLDAVWILSSGAPTTATSRLRGPDDRDYEVTLSASLGPGAAASGDALRMSFQLRDPGALDLPAPGRETSSTPSIDHMLAEMRQDAERRAQRWDLEARLGVTRDELAKMKDKLGERHPELIRKQGELDRLLSQVTAARLGAREAPDFSRRIIDTGFSMDVGETVVVGTSRVRGDKAIIALLTAVPREVKK
jgi:hypothetical protein